MTINPIFVIGSGSMIGSHVAHLFATKGFWNVALFARSPSNLSRNASFISSATPLTSVHTYVADITNDAALRAALEEALSELGTPEVVVYNAARNLPNYYGQYSPADIIEDFKLLNLGLYTTASVLLPHLYALAECYPDTHTALFVTSEAIVHQSLATMASLSMAKAAQTSLTKILAAGIEDVVHVALVTIGGHVSPEEEVNNPAHIATAFWKLYEQKKGDWQFEMKCGW